MTLAGSGGQGMLLLGKLIANVAMKQGKQVTWLPTYGAAVRGGTAYCHVIISDEPIYSPVVEEPDTLIIMNQPSYDKFHASIVAGGLMVLNSSLVGREQPHTATRIQRVPATDIVNELGDMRLGNVVMLGAYTACKDVLTLDGIETAIEGAFDSSKVALMKLNLEALKRGRNYALEHPAATQQ
jgi:2-oxoglutarate ferredoxin oxidoreductase subunit gamma